MLPPRTTRMRDSSLKGMPALRLRGCGIVLRTVRSLHFCNLTPAIPLETPRRMPPMRGVVRFLRVSKRRWRRAQRTPNLPLAILVDYKCSRRVIQGTCVHASVHAGGHLGACARNLRNSSGAFPAAVTILNIMMRIPAARTPRIITS